MGFIHERKGVVDGERFFGVISALKIVKVTVTAPAPNLLITMFANNNAEE